MKDAGAWMPLYIGDYLADTMHLTGAEHGPYLLLIMHYWRTGPLPDDDRSLAAIARTERKLWASEIGPAVRPFFQPRDGKLHHKRIDAEIVAASANVEQKRAAAHARWNRADSGRNAPASAPAPAPAHADASATAIRLESPSPSPEGSKQAARANGHGSGPEPSKDNNFTGIEGKSGRYVVGGFYFDGVRDRVYEAAGIDNAKWLGNDKPLVAWLSDNIEPDLIVTAIRRCAERDKYQVPSTLSYFDKAVREQRA